MYRIAASLFFILFFTLPAESREVTAANLELAANFAQRMQKVYQDGMALSSGMDSAEEFIDAFHAGEIDQGEFLATLDPFLEEMRAGVDDYRTRYPRAPSAPSIGSEKHERSLTGLAKMVVGLGGLLDRQLGILHRLREATLAGDDVAYDAASADSVALVAEMILAENVSLEGSLIAVAPDHPQQGFIKAVMGGNEAMVVALHVMEASLRGQDFNAAEFAVGVETGLREAGRGIVEGEKAARQMLRSLEGKFAKTEADKYGARFIGELVQAYERAFAIERAILDTERGLLDYLRGVNAGTQDADYAVQAVAEFQADLEEQSNSRIEEQNIRTQMTAEFARTLQALQE